MQGHMPARHDQQILCYTQVVFQHHSTSKRLTLTLFSEMDTLPTHPLCFHSQLQLQQDQERKGSTQGYVWEFHTIMTGKRNDQKIWRVFKVPQTTHLKVPSKTQAIDMERVAAFCPWKVVQWKRSSMSSYQQKQPFTPPPKPEQQQVKQPCQPPPPPQKPFVPIIEEPCLPKVPQLDNTKVPEQGYSTLPEPCPIKDPEPVYTNVPQPGNTKVPEACIPGPNQKKDNQK
ncbi:hypothetical protein MJG53_001367 [Ovis ammon polii x Ovis aries]|uniref:Uncharacterized protein n=1 Tax=Ovis ammon polii x Ovis aries TaxID=2918886 RepID=A0ACB9VL34_9CETA|nr:hypothetical protein MJG53_001367 [Ovis ammon polii x Ovis aries]